MTFSNLKRKKRTTLNLFDVHVVKPPFPCACTLRNWTIASPEDGLQSIGCVSVAQYGPDSSFIYIDLKLHIARLRAYARSFYIKTVDSQKVEEFNDRNGTSFKAGYYNIYIYIVCVLDSPDDDTCKLLEANTFSPVGEQERWSDFGLLPFPRCDHSVWFSATSMMPIYQARHCPAQVGSCQRVGRVACGCRLSIQTWPTGVVIWSSP